MDENYLAADKLEVFRREIATVTRTVRQLDELAAWLHSQPFIASVKLEDYLIKTYPPRREFTIGIRMEGGIVCKNILTITTVGAEQFTFQEMREAR